MRYIGIVHSAHSKIIRRIVVPDHLYELFGGHVGFGEAILILPWQKHDLFTCRELVAAHYGISVDSIPSARCAVVARNGYVVRVLMADPEIDRHPDGRLVRHERAAVGDKFVGKRHVPGIAVARIALRLPVAA